MSNEEGLKEVIELLHELKLELVAEMDYASLELQVEAIIDKVYLCSANQLSKGRRLPLGGALHSRFRDP